MKKLKVLLIVLGIMLAFGSLAYAAPYVDVVQATTGYFVPSDAQKYDSPYYRYYSEDWGWTHGAVGGTFSNATLNISAFDVDWASGTDGEHDLIYGWKGGVKTYIGELAGATDIWSYTTFTLDSSWYADIAAGLKVFIDIDSTHTADYWAVALSKSVISIDGGTAPNPQPGAVPEPTTMMLLGLGLIGLVGARKKFKE